MNREEIEAIFSECAEIALEHVGAIGSQDDVSVTPEERLMATTYNIACRDIAEAIKTRASNRKTMDAIADAKVTDLQREKAEMVKALEAISAASPIETGAERLRCRQCGHAWLPNEQEHHGKHCAYQVSRAALALVKP
jgi:hypothetical protein